MEIFLERTRIIFRDYNLTEKHRIEDLAATEDKAFVYQDPDDKYICFPPGLLKDVEKAFPYVKIEDKSNAYWGYQYIQPVTHEAKPRNKLQEDFIAFVLKNVKEKKNVAGILGTGTGKAEPVTTKIPTPTDRGWTYMGDLKPGDQVYDSKHEPINVLAVFPQGIKDIYEIELENGVCTYCSAEHLWEVQHTKSKEREVISLVKLMRRHYKDYSIPIWNPDKQRREYFSIETIKYDRDEEAQCIMVDSEDHLYLSEFNVITHNTFMACYSAIEVGLRTLIIAPTSSIKAQWAETLTGMFNVPKERVLVINSPSQFVNVQADFVIVSQASLASLNKNYDLEKLMKKNQFGIKVIDEVQMWFHNIIKVDGNSNILHNWYITGTFGRSGDEENELYQKMFGNLEIFREKQKDATIFNRNPGNIYGDKPHMITKMVWAKSGLSKEEIKSVNTSVRYSERSGKWHRYGISVPAYMELVIPNDGTMTKFLRTILKTIQKAEQEVTYGRTIVLGNTISSINVIYNHVQAMFPHKKVGTISSKQSTEKNNQVKSECDIIVSTISSCGTGFDMKDLSKLIVFAQYSSWILCDQISGRCRRRPDGKATYMWDIADSSVPQLKKWANNRSDVLRRKSKSFKVVDP